MPQAGFNPPGEKWQLCLNIVVHGWIYPMFVVSIFYQVLYVHNLGCFYFV